MRATYIVFLVTLSCGIALSDMKKAEPKKTAPAYSLKKDIRTDNFTREDFCEAAQKIVYGSPDKKPVDTKKIIASFVGKNAVFWGVVADERLERDGTNVIKTSYSNEDKACPMTVVLYAVFDEVPTGCKKGKEGYIFRGTIRRFDHYADEPLFCILIDC